MDDTGWRPIKNIVGDDNAATGQVEMATGLEQRPCIVCRSWEKDTKRLIEHFLANGLKPRPDGTFVTPIAQDIPGRKSMVINPPDWGYCKRELRPTDGLATCDAWTPVRTASELQSRIK